MFPLGKKLLYTEWPLPCHPFFGNIRSCLQISNRPRIGRSVGKVFTFEEPLG